MKKVTIFIFGIFLSTLVAGNLFAQTPASVVWPCTPDSRIDVNDDTSPSTATSVGDVSGMDEASGNVNWRIRSYSGSASGAAISYQRWWPNDGSSAISWGNESDTVSDRYTEFSMKPTAGSNFALDSIRLFLLGGGTDHIKANIYYSTDDFATSTKLDTNTGGISLLANSASDVVGYTYSPSVSIDAPQTLTVRVYPWYDGSPSTSKYIYFYNVGIYGATQATVLPVELTSFSASTINNKVELKWSTATEINNRGWDIERKAINSSKELTNWEKIGFISGAGSKSQKSNYRFVDDNAVSGKYQYRLKQNDFDGTFKFSKTIEVEVNQNPQSYSLYQNYPNPFNPSTVIKFDLPEAGHVTLNIYNAIGEKVATLINSEMQVGTHEANFNASNLSSGLYFYTITANNFTSTKKMLLLK